MTLRKMRRVKDIERDESEEGYKDDSVVTMVTGP